MLGPLEAADWQFVWNVGQSLLTGAIGLYIYFSQREQVRRVALDNLERDVDGRLDLIGNRLTQIEAKMTEAPRSSRCLAEGQRIATLEEAMRSAIKGADLAQVNIRIEHVNKELAELRGETKGVLRTLQNIEETLRVRG